MVKVGIVPVAYKPAFEIEAAIRVPALPIV
jgi:hypothetical protein